MAYLFAQPNPLDCPWYDREQVAGTSAAAMRTFARGDCMSRENYPSSTDNWVFRLAVALRLLVALACVILGMLGCFTR